MTRDIKERLELFGAYVTVERLALNFDQINTYNPPPNPAKETDSRFEAYLKKYGDKSWELDALNPTILSNLVNSQIKDLINLDEWNNRLQIEQEQRNELFRIAENYSKIVKK